MATSSFYGQISANKRNSFLLAAFVIAIFAVLGFSDRLRDHRDVQRARRV